MSTRGVVSSAQSGAASAVEIEPSAAEARVRAALGRDSDAASDRPGVANGPLSEAQLVALERAAARLRALGRAGLLARLHAGTMLACALLTLPFTLFDPSLLWLVVLLASSGASELHGARLLRALDARGPRWLGVQQLLLLAAIAVYCGASIHAALGSHGISAELAQAHPDLSQVLDDAASEHGKELAGALDGAYRAAAIGFYLTLLFASALYQGAVAYFHMSRAPLLRAYLRETPHWAIEAMRRLRG